MNLEKARALASGDINNTETIAFKINAEKKAAFVEFCKTENLSIGRLMRVMIDDLMEQGK